MMSAMPNRATATSCFMFFFSLGSSITLIGSRPIWSQTMPSPVDRRLVATISICASSKRFDLFSIWNYILYLSPSWAQLTREMRISFLQKVKIRHFAGFKRSSPLAGQCTFSDLSRTEQPDNGIYFKGIRNFHGTRTTNRWHNEPSSLG